MYKKVTAPFPVNVQAISTRRGKLNDNRNYSGFNIALHVGADITDTMRNRQTLQNMFNIDIAWLDQVHGNQVTLADAQNIHKADASCTSDKYLACAIMTADCLPVLLSNRQGTKVAAIHCGWRSLATNIIQKTVDTMQSDAKDIIVWLGPAIASCCFEVGLDVKNAFMSYKEQQDQFVNVGNGKYLADIYKLAIINFNNLGIYNIYKDQTCTMCNNYLYSYRRDKQTGRQVSLIWIT